MMTPERHHKKRVGRRSGRMLYFESDTRWFVLPLRRVLVLMA